MPNTHQFPSIALSESKKDKTYYRKWVESIVSNTFTSPWATSYNKLSMLYNFYKVGTGSDLTGYLQTAPDGSVMPGIWTSQNTVHTRIKALVGELEERGYMIKARALNSEAFVRKFDERERLRVERYLQGIAKYAEKLTGMSLRSGEYIPQTDEELDEHMDITWKDKHVQILEAALKWIARRSHWDQTRIELFEDIFIANIVVERNEIIRSVPQPFRVDPLKFIYDPNATGDTLEDSTYFGEVDYMPLAAAAERYGLSLDEMQQCYKEYKDYLGLGLAAKSEHAGDSYFGCMPGQTVKWFKDDDGTPRCLVLKACWRDIKILEHKHEKKEQYDAEFIQDVTGQEVKKKDRDKIIKNKIECWRQGTLIGGKFLREWGECPNQARSLSSLEKSEPPYNVWRITKSLSLVEQLVGLQLLKDVALYQLQVQMARAIGKVLVFDEAFLPEGMTKDSVMGRLKADGIAWVNSKEYQLGTGNLNLFKEYDLSLSASIAQSIQLVQYFDQQIDAISGINSERQGQVQGASQAVGVTQSALFQSNLITAPYFKGFERFCSRTMNHLAKMVKIAWGEGDNEKFAPIIGDTGIDFLKTHYDLQLDEFDVEVLCLPPSNVDRQTLVDWLTAAVQSDPGFLNDALMIMLEPDTSVAIRKYHRKYALRQLFLNQQEQENMQAENQLRERELAIQEAQLAFQQENSPLALQASKNASNREKTLITSRTKLNSEKLRLLS